MCPLLDLLDPRLTDSSRLEIGAGGGLVGLAVARGCSVETPLYITDQLEMFELMKHNIILNKVQERAKALILNWFVPSPPRRHGRHADVPSSPLLNLKSVDLLS